MPHLPLSWVLRRAMEPRYVGDQCAEVPCRHSTLHRRCPHFWELYFGFCYFLHWPLLAYVINESFVLINLNIGNEISCLLVKLG